MHLTTSTAVACPISFPTTPCLYSNSLVIFQNLLTAVVGKHTFMPLYLRLLLIFPRPRVLSPTPLYRRKSSSSEKAQLKCPLCEVLPHSP